MELIDINLIKENPFNPRHITTDKLQLLQKSITEFEDMLKIRPIIIDENNIILGGNMRYKAAKLNGLKQVWVQKEDGLTDEQKREFIIKDNVTNGDWTTETLNANWDTELLDNWGVYVLPDTLPSSYIEDFFVENQDEPQYVITLKYNKSEGNMVLKELTKLNKSKEEAIKILLGL